MVLQGRLNLYSLVYMHVVYHLSARDERAEKCILCYAKFQRCSCMFIRIVKIMEFGKVLTTAKMLKPWILVVL
jgi:hypothetical protein